MCVCVWCKVLGTILHGMLVLSRLASKEGTRKGVCLECFECFECFECLDRGAQMGKKQKEQRLKCRRLTGNCACYCNACLAFGGEGCSLRSFIMQARPGQARARPTWVYFTVQYSAPGRLYSLLRDSFCLGF